MKNIIMAALVFIAGTASAQVVSNALNELKASAPAGTEIIAPATPASQPVDQPKDLVNLSASDAKTVVKDGCPEPGLRIKDCYSTHHIAVDTVGSGIFSDILAVEAGRAFLKCQMKKEPQLMKKDARKSSGEIILILGNALGEDLPAFAKIFDQALK